MSLIALEDRFGHLLRADNAARLTPSDEETQITLAVLHRALRVVLHPQRLQEALHPHVETLGVVRFTHGGLRSTAAFLRHRSAHRAGCCPNARHRYDSRRL